MAATAKNNIPALPGEDPKLRDAVSGKTEGRVAGQILEQRGDFIDLHGSLGDVMEEMSTAIVESGINKEEQKRAVSGKLNAGANVAIDLFEQFHAAFATMHDLIDQGKVGANASEFSRTFLAKLEKARGAAASIATNGDCKKEIEAAFSAQQWSGEKLQAALVTALRAAGVVDAEKSASIFIGQLEALHSSYQLLADKQNTDAVAAAGSRKDVLAFMTGAAASKETILDARKKTSVEELAEHLKTGGFIEKDSVAEVVIDFQRVCFVRANDAKATRIARALLDRTYGFGVTEVVKRPAFMSAEQMKLCKTVRVRPKDGDGGAEVVLNVVGDGPKKGKIGIQSAEAKALGITSETTEEDYKKLFDYCVPNTFGVSEA